MKIFDFKDVTHKDRRAFLFAGLAVLLLVLIFVFVYQPLYQKGRETPTSVGQQASPKPREFLSEARDSADSFVAPVDELFTPQN